MANDQEIVIIKKYANRRLYNTQTSSYITLDDVSTMVKNGEEFAVQDAKTGDDLTRQVLTQIIFEQELNGKSVLPVAFLKRVIGLYDDKVSELIPAYLDNSMEVFSQNQEQFRGYLDKAWNDTEENISGFNPIQQLEEMGKKNTEMLTQAFQMFNPFDSFFAANEKANEADAKKKASK